jgi:RHS repeat-associated protein
MTDGTTEDFTSRVTWSSSSPAVATIAAGGLATAHATGETTIRAAFTFTAVQTGLPVTVEQSTALTVQINLAINAVSPNSGAVGDLITLTGAGFDTVPANNQLVFRGINNTTVPATALTATLNRITLKVPPLAETGPITLTNSRGSVQSPPFTVVRDQDFQLIISPATLTVYQGASVTAQAQISSIGAKLFTGLATLSVQGLPAGIAPSFSSPSLSVTQAGAVTFGAVGSAPLGSHPLTVTAEMKEGGLAFKRTANVTLNVLASTGVTGIKGRFVTPQGAGIAGIIVRADIATTPQPQTTTDTAGNFVLTGLPAGKITMRFDATPAHPLYPIWPQTIDIAANKIFVMEDWIISPPPPDERFTAISANSPVTQVITDPRFPGLEIKIPAGTTIVGWDGVPKSRMAVERLDPDKLPVAAPPIKTKSVYQLYFGTPMGGLPSQPIPVTLPNDLGLEPGMKTPLYYYDGSPMGGTGEWKQGGTGTVSADGSVIITDPGSGIPRFCGVCGLPCFEAAQNETPNPPCNDCDGNTQSYGKPVNLATGQELDSAVDMVVDGEVPIVIRRVFNPFEAFAYIANYQQSLGINWTFAGYDVAMMPFGGDFSIRIVLPGNARVDFKRGADGKFRSGGYSMFDGAEISKIGGSNPTSVGALFGATLPPSDGAPVAPTCPVDGSFYIMRFRDGREWRFDAAPNATKIKIRGGCLYFLTEMRDPQGRFLQIQRGEGKIQRITTSGGTFVNFTYSTGVVSSVTDHTGRTVTYNHVSVPTKGGFRAFGATTDGTGSSRAATEAAAITAGLIPIPPRRLVSAVTPEGTYAYTYEDDPPELRIGALSFTDGSGASAPISAENPSCQNVRGGTRLKTIQLPGVQGVFTNFYGPSKRVLKQTWPDGTEIFFKYKVVGGCVPGLPSFAAQPTEGAKLTGGSNTSTCTGAGCVRIDSWDGQAVTGGTVVGVEVVDSRGKNFAHDFNGSGLATKVVDENGQERTLMRDAQNRVLRSTDALGRSTFFEYDSRGNRTKITDPAGRVTDIVYDGKWSKPILVMRRLDAATMIQYQYTYDNAIGVLKTSTDPEGNVTTFEYDVNKRLSLIRDPLLHETRIEYDTRGNPARITDHLGNSVETASDSLGRITQTTDALGYPTLASYNNLNQLTTITDANQGVTRFNFDARNKLASVVNPLNHTIESYGYDTIGRLATKTDAKLKSETYQYDGNGNVTSITDRRLQTTTVAYDNANRPLRITFHDGSVQERSYDAIGRLSEVREGDNAQRMEYDNLNRVVRVVTDTPAGLTSVAYEYDVLDRRTKRTLSYPGGVLEETVYAYDKASRLVSITQSGVNGIQVTTYTWDGASRLVQKVLSNGIKQELAYDEANRVLSITYKRTDDSIIETVSYTYDANGQRRSKSVGTASVAETPITAMYDEANRVNSFTLNPGTTGATTYNLTYDDHGNIVRKQNAASPSEDTRYEWDARNRLARITMSEGTQASIASFKYDALGRRIERLIEQGSGTQRTQYVYDGIQPIGELTEGGLAATILTGLSIDEVIARTVNVATATSQNPITTKAYLTDALGSVLAIAKADQNPEVFYSYSPYGETQALGVDGDIPANSNQYTARENDGRIGGTGGGSLYYYRARYYDPVLKRFVSEDPIGLRGGRNLYAYVEANPINSSDPLGLTAQDIQNMVELVYITQSDLNVPLIVDARDLGTDIRGNQITGFTNPITLNISVSDKYLERLNCDQVIQLFEIIVHESIHRTRPRMDMILRPSRHPDIYEEAARRTKESVDFIRNYCPCPK